MGYIKDYVGRFKEGEEFTVFHMLILGVLFSVPLGGFFWLLREVLRVVYNIFW